jgi:hypothetical protein
MFITVVLLPRELITANRGADRHRAPIQHLVPAQGAENQVLDEVCTAFQAAKPPEMDRFHCVFTLHFVLRVKRSSPIAWQMLAKGGFAVSVRLPYIILPICRQ